MGPLDDQVVREDALTATDDGLDVAVHTHWYRALPLSCVASIRLTVDEGPIDPATLELSVNGHRYTLVEAAEQTGESWFTTDPLVLHTSVPSAPGRTHRVRLDLGLSIPYILTGPERNPLLAVASTDSTLVAH